MKSANALMETELKKWELLGRDMLRRRHEEMAGGGGPDNILEKFDVIRETGDSPGGLPPSGAGMLSPRAEDADFLLRKMRKLSPSSADYMEAFGAGLSVEDMARVFHVKRHKAHNDFRSASAYWTAFVYWHKCH